MHGHDLSQPNRSATQTKSFLQDLGTPITSEHGKSRAFLCIGALLYFVLSVLVMRSSAVYEPSFASLKIDSQLGSTSVVFIWGYLFLCVVSLGGVSVIV